jgi:hypothetical protein
MFGIDAVHIRRRRFVVSGRRVVAALDERGRHKAPRYQATTFAH